MQKVIEYSNTYNIVAVNISISSKEHTDMELLNEYIYEYNQYFEVLREKGILIVVAAGNQGVSLQNRVPSACDENVITVSSIKQNEDGTYSYNYWDNRTIYSEVVYDINGNIIEFIG